LTADPATDIAEKLLTRLPASPDVYPQKIDVVREAVLLIALDADAYRAASFLDDRILTPATVGAWLGAAAVAEATLRLPVAVPVHFIFHTGHVGSTLVSRLLDDTGVVLGLREPLPLRTLADAHDVLARPESLLGAAEFDLLLATFVRLWGRGYAGTRAVVVKATSSAGRLAVPLLAREVAARAIYLNVRAEPYLATLLAGQNSALDLRGHGPERIRRLQQRTAVPVGTLSALSPGEMAALAWLAETGTQRDALTRFPARVLAVDFDAFLADVGATTARVLAHFGLPADERSVAELVRSPVLARYSKAPELGYSAELRAEVLRDARRDHGAEIRKGLAWLERLARADPAIARVLGDSNVIPAAPGTR
jgi:hypothetical protein